MKPELLLSVDSKQSFWIDPRTKLYMLVIFSIVMIDGKTDGISFWLKPILALIPFFLLLSGRRKKIAIGECFLFSNIQLTEKIKKISSGGCKNASQRFVLMKGYLGGKNKKLSSRACIYALHLLNICKDIFEPA